MDPFWRAILWAQFGAAIDMLDNALAACPDSLWRHRLWHVPSDPADHPLPPELAEFWYLAYHALFWLDLYLSGTVEGFAPPAPFTLEELDPTGVVPARPYTKDELRTYLAYARQKCHTTLTALTDERARQPADFPWARGQAASYVELQLYNMRHVQEHAAQLSLALGQHGIHTASIRKRAGSLAPRRLPAAAKRLHDREPIRTCMDAQLSFDGMTASTLISACDPIRAGTLGTGTCLVAHR